MLSSNSVADTSKNTNIENTKETMKKEEKHESNMNAEAILIDVRTKEEYEEGHLENAINIPYDEISKNIINITNNKDVKIDVYCKSGRRSGIAERTLIQMGYKNVQNLGSYSDLLKSKDYILP